VVVDKASKTIICTQTVTQGRQHDRKLLAASKVRFLAATKAILDSGYQGFQKEHQNTAIPAKKTKLKPLSKEQKKTNRQLASDRVLAENVIGSLKRFRILAERYRNRRKRFGLRFTLIATIYNMELDFP
jgi:hypothetical protein